MAAGSPLRLPGQTKMAKLKRRFEKEKRNVYPTLLVGSLIRV